jgi:hypothetical protein
MAVKRASKCFENSFLGLGIGFKTVSKAIIIFQKTFVAADRKALLVPAFRF